MSDSSQDHHENPNINLSDPWESTSSAFDHLSLSGNNQSSRSTNPMIFRDGRAARPSDVFIALMGVTGSGKSSFISLCCKRAAKVGHELQACTKVVDVYAYESSASKTVYLIDTPGFDDTNRSDTETLREIAGWLTASYSNRVFLHGIIYLQRITDVRMQGSAKKYLLMFKKLCGNDALQKVVLATTMWDKVPHREAENREKQLIDTPEFWGFMVSKGSTVYRHNNTAESAIRIIEELSRSNRTVILDLQNQMVIQEQNLEQTAAGKELVAEQFKERLELITQLKDTQEKMEKAIRLEDKKSEQALQDVKDKYNTRIEHLGREAKRLHIDVEWLRNPEIERPEEAFEKQNKTHASELRKFQQKHVKFEKASKETTKVSKPVSKPASGSNSVSTSVYHGKEFFASLHANRYALLGPQRNSVFHLPNRLEARDDGFFVCGTEGVWIYNYDDTTANVTIRKIARHTALKAHYPQLNEKLDNCSHAEILWISLGPNQTFFVKFKKGFYYWLTPAISSKIDEVEDDDDITTVALGVRETYVIIYGGKWKWHLKGLYGGLDTCLENAESAPRLVALNSYTKEDYLFLGSKLKYNLSNSLGDRGLEHFQSWKLAHDI